MLSSGFSNSKEKLNDFNDDPKATCNMSHSFAQYNLDGDLIGYQTYYNTQEVSDSRHCDLAYAGWVRRITFIRAAGL